MRPRCSALQLDLRRSGLAIVHDAGVGLRGYLHTISASIPHNNNVKGSTFEHFLEHTDALANFQSIVFCGLTFPNHLCEPNQADEADERGDDNCHRIELASISFRLQQPWSIECWFGAWDPDGLSGFMQGYLGLPLMKGADATREKTQAREIAKSMDHPELRRL